MGTFNLNALLHEESYQDLEKNFYVDGFLRDAKEDNKNFEEIELTPILVKVL